MDICDDFRGSFRQNGFCCQGTGQVLPNRTAETLITLDTSLRTPQGRDTDERRHNKESDKTSTVDGPTFPKVEDIFRERPWKPSTFFSLKKAYIYLLSFLRLVICCFLFLSVLVGLVSSRLGLLIATRGLSDEVKDIYVRSRRALLFVSIFIVPDLFTFLKCILNRKELPPVKPFVLEIMKEIVGTMMLILFVFQVIPQLNGLEFATYLVGTNLMPAVLTSTSRLVDTCSKRQTIKGIREIGKAAAAMLGHVIAALLTLLVPILYFTSCFYDFPSVTWSFIFNKSWHSDTVTLGLLGFLFLSVRWLENYLPKHLELECLPSVVFQKSPEKHCAITLASSLMRVTVAVIMFHAYISETGIDGIASSLSDVCVTENTDAGIADYSFNCTNCHKNKLELLLDCQLKWGVITPVLVMFLSSVLVYHAASVACQLCMQRVVFSSAIFLSEIIYLLLCITSLGNTLGEWVGGRSAENVIGYNSDVSTYLLPVYFAGMSAVFMTTIHVWKCQLSRMAPVGRLFLLPHFSIPTAAFSLLHSRRKVILTDLPKTPSSTGSTGVQKLTACATLWKEKETEMESLISSLYKLEKALVRDKTKKRRKEKLDTYKFSYEFEARIYFDNAFIENSEKKRVWNEHVHRLVGLIPRAASKGVGKKINPQGRRFKMPYGERLVYPMLCYSNLVIELKDVNKIKIKKRWSQVMYMLQILHYKLCGKKQVGSGRPTGRNSDSPFSHLPEDIVANANNTFILTLDGDVEFEPDAVITLLDTINRDDNIGAVCGRLIPVGNGLIAWYQKFEYAIGHWLQKSTENIAGSVLCSPGCFSLFRAKALMDDNVLKIYMKTATKAEEFLKFDQGEDRWLTTLLLLQGWKIMYAASASAQTCCPDSFEEFFKQRRRWITSTIANIIALNNRWSELVYKNKNIGHCFMLYSLLLFVSSILGPSTVLLAIESAIDAVFNFPTWLSVLLSFTPTILYILLCIKGSNEAQITWAFVLSSLYALLMMAVIVGTMVNIIEEGWYAPNALFLILLTFAYVVAGILHPGEWLNLLCGIIYFMCIPAGYLFLIIFAVCNCNSLEWGTRNKGSNDEKENTVRKHAKCFKLLYDLVEASNTYLQRVNGGDLSETDSPQSNETSTNTTLSIPLHLSKYKTDRNEIQYWEQILSKELKPEEYSDDVHDANTEGRVAAGARHGSVNPSPCTTEQRGRNELKTKLLELRRLSCLTFFLVNAIWLVIMLSLKQVQSSVFILIPNSNKSGEPIKIQPLNLVFLGLFATILLIQLVAMICQRYQTFLYIISKATIYPDTRYLAKDFNFNSEFDAIIERNVNGTLTQPSDSKTSKKNQPFESVYEQWCEAFHENIRDPYISTHGIAPKSRIPQSLAGFLKHFDWNKE